MTSIYTGDYVQLAPTTYPISATFVPCNASEATVTVRFQQLSTTDFAYYEMYVERDKRLEMRMLFVDLYDVITISQCVEWDTCYTSNIHMSLVTDNITDIDTYWIMVENGQTYQGQFSVDTIDTRRNIDVCIY